jgi:hypothetical protein
MELVSYQGENDEMGGVCSTNEEKRNAYRLLVGMVEGRKPLGRPRRRSVNLVEVGLGDVAWIGLGQDRDRGRAIVNAVMNLRVP